MERAALHGLAAWLVKPGRKPLILRGARQVGKTWLVREAARRAGLQLIEVNFERTPLVEKHFGSNDPAAILAELSLALGQAIDLGHSLLFLDEIQAARGVLAKLRWFAELMPALPVIAAGSLLDFTLHSSPASMPVGRVEYLYVEPMSFPEYLLARGEIALLDHLRAWRWEGEFSPAAHTRAGDLLMQYMMVGGMPAVVAAHTTGATPRECRRLQHDLVTTFRDDFARYSSRLDREVLDHCLLAVAAMLGQKFVYSRVGGGLKQHQVKQALQLLLRARVCHLVPYTTASGLPLGGETKDTFRKAILLDVGLLQALLGTPAAEAFPAWETFSDQVRGQMADQLAGQQLRIATSGEGHDASLFYWQREGGRPGEIDYLIQTQNRIIPIELKSGASGAMKSLHQFMSDKHLNLAVRLDSNPPSLQAMDVRTTQGVAVKYQLVNLPHYLAWNLPQLLTSTP